METDKDTLFAQADGADASAVSHKVLIAEDDTMQRRLLDNWLKRLGYTVIPAASGTEAWDILQQPEPPQLAVLDWMMPGMNGVDVCRAIRGRSNEPYAYVILLTGKNRKEDLLEGLAAGADDYLTKPVDKDELTLRLRTGRRIIELQKDLIQAREALREQAYRDALTGLWNRRAIMETLNRELERTEREGGDLAVIICDLDHFKRVNDTYGHPVGDAVLQEAARRMQSGLRKYDHLGRIGGEEFLIILSGCDGAKALVLADRIRQCVGTTPMPTAGGNVPVTMSLGIAVSGTHHRLNSTALVSDADTALYKAKDTGRNRAELGQSALLPIENTPMPTPLQDTTHA